ncbi:MAG TPA: ATP-binding protein [Thermoanaerobaculia bacterium]|nr:ATP-binding protein [Thermoanaerobaculia bacterium]
MRFLTGIPLRLLLFNVLLVFLPAAGFLYLDVYERELLEAQERAMVQQGRHLAAALSDRGDLDSAKAEGLLRRLDRRTDARLRILGTGGTLLADSAAFGPRRVPVPAEASRYTRDPAPEGARQRLAYRVGAWLYSLPQRVKRVLGAPQPEPPESFYDHPGKPLLGTEVRAALAGRYGATTRRTPGQRSLTLYSAIPVRNEGRVVGAVLVSQSTYRLLGALYEVRLGIFRVFLASVAAAIVLTLLVSTTIARPLRRLRDEANVLLDRRGRLRGRFRGSSRKDEIGDLARALEELTRRLEGHLGFIESFASDVSHELKNPLAAIRSATELLAEVEDPADRQRFLGVVQKEVARMEGLLSGVREVSEIDARLEAEEARPVALDALLGEVVESRCLRADNGTKINLQRPLERIVVRASPERLTQVLENLLDNAASFSPEGEAVEVSVGRDGASAVVTVEDSGPGIPEAHLDRIFDRFFTWRPSEPGSRNGHTGLGLAIVKAIVDGYGGSIVARNRPGGGSRFEVRLPAV